MKQLILASFLILLVYSTAKASVINCHTPRHDKEFVLSADKVVLKGAPGREIASEMKASTRFEGAGYTKLLEYKGLRYTIHVENEKSFSENSDYLLMRSSEGHEIIYPLICN